MYTCILVGIRHAYMQQITCKRTRIKRPSLLTRSRIGYFIYTYTVTAPQREEEKKVDDQKPNALSRERKDKGTGEKGKKGEAGEIPRKTRLTW